jgi:hypothetical protein
MPADQFLLGQHEALLKQVIQGQDNIFARLGSIESNLAERRGERRVGTALWSTTSGAFGALIVFITRAWMAKHATP